MGFTTYSDFIEWEEDNEHESSNAGEIKHTLDNSSFTGQLRDYIPEYTSFSQVTACCRWDTNMSTNASKGNLYIGSTSIAEQTNVKESKVDMRSNDKKEYFQGGTANAGIPSSNLNIHLQGNSTWLFRKFYYRYSIRWYPIWYLSITNSSGSGYYNMGQQVNLRADSKTGYSFASWSDGVNTEDRTVTVSNNMELTVLYTLNTYSISYDLNGGTVSIENPTEYTVNSSFILKRPEKEGYTFTGWTGTGLTEKTLDVTISNMTGPRSYTANFEENSYTINFVSGQGTGTMQPVTLKYTQEYILPKASFSAPYYDINYELNGATQPFNTNDKAYRTFSLWQKNDMSGTTYNAGEKVSKLTPNNNENIYIEALWSSDGSLTLSTPKRKYHNFIGWKNFSSNDTYQPDIEIKFDKNTILIAQWKKIHYRAFVGIDDLQDMYVRKNKKISRIFLGTDEI